MDYKNLEYFMTAWKLTERQMQWLLVLSQYNFTINYRPGKENLRADALSWREQDMPTDVTDNCLQFRMVQLIKPKMIKEDSYGSIMVSPVTIQEQGIRDLSQNDIMDQFLHLQLLPDDL